METTKIIIPSKLMEMLQNLTDTANSQIKAIEEEASASIQKIQEDTTNRITIMLNAFLSDKEYPTNATLRLEGDALVFDINNDPDDNNNNSTAVDSQLP